MLVIGAVYMLYLAWETLRSSDSIKENHSHDGFLSGLFLQFINPKYISIALCPLEAYILPFYSGQFHPLFGFAMLLAFIGFVFTLCWSAFGSAFKWLFFQTCKASQYHYGCAAGLLRASPILADGPAGSSSDSALCR